MPTQCAQDKSAITPTMQWLKCVNCNTAYRIRCINLSKAAYDVLKNNGWRCTNCRDTVLSANAKCDCCKIIPKLNETIQKLSDAVDHLKSQLLQVNNTSTLNDIDIEEVITEVADREQRKKNLLFFGIPEHKSEIPPAERKCRDKNTITEFLSFIGEQNGDPTFDVLRLGKFTGELQGSKPRPLRVQFRNEQQVRDTLRVIRNSKDRIKNSQLHKNIGVSIAPRQSADTQDTQAECGLPQS